MSMIKRLMSKILIHPRTRCWIWTGWRQVTPRGQRYGRIQIGGRLSNGGSYQLAHRVAYELFNGPIKKGMEVCHSCDTEGCINPDHLWLGTHLENMQDMLSKGRARDRFGRVICQTQIC